MPFALAMIAIGIAVSCLVNAHFIVVARAFAECAVGILVTGEVIAS